MRPHPSPGTPFRFNQGNAYHNWAIVDPAQARVGQRDLPSPLALGHPLT